VETDAEERENAYREQVSRVTAENNQLRATVTDLRREIEALQRRKSEVQSSAINAPSQFNVNLTQVASPAPSPNADGTHVTHTDRPIIDRSSLRSSSTWANSFSTKPSLNIRKSPEVIEIDDDEDEDDEEEDEPLTVRPEGCCGGTRCSRSGGCGSIMDSTVSIHHLHKRSTSDEPPSNKRPRFVNVLSELETDFTDVFMSSKKRGAATQDYNDNDMSYISPESELAVSDPCGFCSDGTPCVCAEMAKIQQDNSDLGLQGFMDRDEDQTLPPILSLDNLDGLPSLSLASSNTTTQLLLPPAPLHPPPTSAFVGCTGEPGTCTQCQSDPMSTLFCRTLASGIKNSSNSTANGACCGGTACGKNVLATTSSSSTLVNDKDVSTPMAATTTTTTVTPANIPLDDTPLPTPSTLMSLPSLNKESRTYIPCSAAYQALSRHKKFEEASADLGQLVGKLNTKGMQVEVASVRDVLKYLDREFGKG